MTEGKRHPSPAAAAAASEVLCYIIVCYIIYNVMFIML